METVSIIVPVYNTARYLAECVESIRCQSYENLEILLIDDGSTDESGTICEEFSGLDRRIRVIHQENRGLSAARNRGLDTASGQYICFVDSDDAIGETMVEDLRNTLKWSKADMALCNILRNGGATPMPPEVLGPESYLEKLLEPEAWYYITMPNRLCRRELWDGLRFPEGYLHEDEAVIYPLAARCRRIAIRAEALYFYRTRPDSITARPGIAHSDKLRFLAERILFCRKRNWRKGLHANCLRFCHTFWEFYLGFSEDSKYFRRMEDALKLCFRELLRSPAISARHKLYFTAVRFFRKRRQP